MWAVGSADDSPTHVRPVFSRFCGRCPDRLFFILARRFIVFWRRVESAQIRVILDVHEMSPNDDGGDQQAAKYQQPEPLGDSLSRPLQALYNRSRLSQGGQLLGR
jgi:hypothetical protein